MTQCDQSLVAVAQPKTPRRRSQRTATTPKSPKTPRKSVGREKKKERRVAAPAEEEREEGPRGPCRARVQEKIPLPSREALPPTRLEKLEREQANLKQEELAILHIVSKLNQKMRSLQMDREKLIALREKQRDKESVANLVEDVFK